MINLTAMDLPILNVFESRVQIPIVKEVKTETKQETKYTVKKEDNLSRVAKKYKTTWQRIFYKNKQIKDPNRLEVGQILEIPKKGERLKKRTYYIPTPTVVPAQVVNRDNVVKKYIQPTLPEGHGNFEWGWCTWFAQSQRPDRKFSGNAADWIVYANSLAPSVGAVAVTVGGLGHVAIVRQVDGDRVFVEEMNYEGFGIISSRWTTTSEFQGYII